MHVTGHVDQFSCNFWYPSTFGNNEACWLRHHFSVKLELEGKKKLRYSSMFGGDDGWQENSNGSNMSGAVAAGYMGNPVCWLSLQGRSWRCRSVHQRRTPLAYCHVKAVGTRLRLLFEALQWRGSLKTALNAFFNWTRKALHDARV